MIYCPQWNCTPEVEHLIEGRNMANHLAELAGTEYQ